MVALRVRVEGKVHILTLYQDKREFPGEYDSWKYNNLGDVLCYPRERVGELAAMIEQIRTGTSQVYKKAPKP